MLGLVYSHALKGGRKAAGYAADGDDAEMDTRTQTSKRFNPRQCPQGNGDTV